MSLLQGKNIAILGGGIIGLTTAHQLLELYEKAYKSTNKPLNITIFGENYGNETTSDGAGGLFRPGKTFF